MHSYFIYLENEQGQKGYHGLVMSVDPPDYRVLKYACSEMQVGFSSHSRSNSIMREIRVDDGLGVAGPPTSAFDMPAVCGW